VGEFPFESVLVTEPALCDVAPVAAVMVVDAAYVFMAPTVLTSVKFPLFTELPESVRQRD